MSRSINRRLALTAVAALGLALLLAAAAAAKHGNGGHRKGDPKVVRVGNLFLSDHGGVFPTRLPRDRMTPASAQLYDEIGTVDGSHPPAMKAVSFYVDRAVGIDTRGLPTCRRQQLLARSSADAKRVCGKALIGTGTAEVEVAFDEQAPFSARGPLYLFNGGSRGRTTTVFLHSYLAVPVPTAVVVRATVTRVHRGPYGLHVEAEIPKIAGGAASVTRFDLRIARRFKDRGRRRSFLNASCPHGRWLTQGVVRFAGGTHLSVQHTFPCVPS